MQCALSTLRGVHVRRKGGGRGGSFEEHIAHQTATYRHTNKFANEHVPTRTRWHKYVVYISVCVCVISVSTGRFLCAPFDEISKLATLGQLLLLLLLLLYLSFTSSSSACLLLIIIFLSFSHCTVFFCLPACLLPSSGNDN